jgi:hypothetical protein
MHARDYMHLVSWEYPDAWKDFEKLAAKCATAGVRLWLYLPPPTEPPAPKPYEGDYVTWARACATVAKKYPKVVAGICIDDFCANTTTFKTAYCKQMMDEARSLAPSMRLFVVAYAGQLGDLERYLHEGVIDGVVFPYIRPQFDHTTTDTLMPQIQEFRTWLNRFTNRAGLCRRVSLVVMVYASGYSGLTAPTPDFVKACLNIGLDATKRGWPMASSSTVCPRVTGPSLRQ